MAKRKMKKVVVVHLLEAAKSALDHMGRWRMELDDTGQPCPAALTAAYGDVRRVRDYLQRCMSAYLGDVAWDMSGRDENLLVSCVGHALREIDAEVLSEGLETGDHRDTWLKEKQKILVGWAVELATEDIEDLPAPKVGRVNAFALQELQNKIRRNLGGATPGEMNIVQPFADLGSAVPRGSRAGADSFGMGEQGGLQPENSVPEATMTDTPVDPPVRPDADQPVNPAVDESVDPAPAPAPQVSHEALLDARTVRDPRLRAVLSLDQGALRRALDARDYRLGVVHLSSILEAVVIDYVLVRRKELGISGTPDGWNLPQILLKLLGSKLGPRDRGNLIQVLTASDLVRPVSQYMAPMVVTPTSFQHHFEFVKMVLVQLGYRGPAGPDSSSARGHGYRNDLSPKGPLG